jgi:anti-anti-sigma regulatory factor
LSFAVGITSRINDGSRFSFDAVSSVMQGLLDFWLLFVLFLPLCSSWRISQLAGRASVASRVTPVVGEKGKRPRFSPDVVGERQTSEKALSSVCKPLREQIEAYRSGGIVADPHSSRVGVARFFVGLGNLHYIDSTGLGSLVRLNREVKARDGALHFYNPAPPVRDIFELTHLDKVLDIDETRKAAFDKADKK